MLFGNWIALFNGFITSIDYSYQVNKRKITCLCMYPSQPNQLRSLSEPRKSLLKVCQRFIFIKRIFQVSNTSLPSLIWIVEICGNKRKSVFFTYILIRQLTSVIKKFGNIPNHFHKILTDMGTLKRHLGALDVSYLTVYNDNQIVLIQY